MINGFIIIDKPAGITSHDVVSRVRRILGTRKVGHTGTLDPFATGVLPVAVNDGTKVIPFLDEGTKVYEAEMRLGVTTDTLDMTGSILSESDPSLLTHSQLNTVLTGFTGTIQQTPPMYSAIKQDGQPLYKLARQGVEVERKAREVTIHSLELLSFSLPYASIRVHCSRGTYIRSLADDIGRTCGLGAALKNLRRIASGPFHIEQAITLDELATAADEERVTSLCLLPLAVLNHLPEIELTSEGMAGLAFGRSPSWQATVRKIPLNMSLGTVVCLTYNGMLVATAALVPGSGTDSVIALKRVFVQ